MKRLTDPPTDMNARTMLKDEAGITLVELLVGVGIAAGIATLIGTIVFQFFTVSRQGSDRMAVTSDLQSATLWLGRDGLEAHSFSSGASPVYGTFHASQPGGDHEFRYLYDSSRGHLVREHYVDGSLQSSQSVARYIASEADVTFNPQGTVVSVSLTATLGGASDSLLLDLALRSDSP